MKKNYMLCGLLIITCLFTSCNKNESKTNVSSTINYNNYQQFGYRNIAWTPEGTYYVDDSSNRGNFFLHYISNAGEQNFLCSKPECKHTGVDCEAYISSNQLLYYNNTLCYIEETDNHNYIIYSMNKQGKNRKKYLTLPFSKVFDEVYGTDEFASPLTYIKYCDNTFTIMYSSNSSSQFDDVLYWVSLDQPSEIHKVAHAEDVQGITLMKVSSHWLYWIQCTKQEKYELISYNLETGKENLLLDGEKLINGQYCDFEKLNKTDLYWFEMGKGLWHKDLITDEVELLYDCSDMGSMAQASFMSDYVVVSNMVEYNNSISPKDQSLLFLDRKGNKICHIDVNDSAVDYVAMIEDENNIYFKDVATGKLMKPVAYIKKSEIKNGTAKIKPIKDLYYELSE